MENQGGGGDIFANGVNSQNNLPALYNNNQNTPTLADIERLLFSSIEIHHDQNQEVNESEQEKLNDVSSRKRGRWSIEEDRKLLSLVNKHGVGKWARIAWEMDGRGGKQCYARWTNHLRPDIKKKDRWSEEEEKAFIEAHQILGNKWADIAKRIPGRSENSIKNHWHATKRKQLSMRKRMPNNEATILKDYMNTKILKESDVHNSRTATPSTNSTI